MATLEVVPDTVRAWEDDPGVPPSGRVPVPRPRPQLDRQPLPVGIRGSEPAPGSDEVGSSEFRYWVAAEALRRAADFWSEVTPQGTTWHETVGSALTAGLNEGKDLNAYYDR